MDQQELWSVALWRELRNFVGVLAGLYVLLLVAERLSEAVTRWRGRRG